jgi:signal transduction histidine kinase
MRFRLKTKETLAVTAFTVLVVAAATVLHFSQLTRVSVQGVLNQADLVAQQIYAQNRRALARAPGKDPWEVLRGDSELRSLLDDSVGYSTGILDVLLADPTSTIILHSEARKEGSMAPARLDLRSILGTNAVTRFILVYKAGMTYEVTLPVRLNERPFGSIRIGVPTTFLRRELNASLLRGLGLAGVVLPVAWLVAIGLAHGALQPIRRLTREVERLRQGEQGALVADPELGGEEEFKELAAQLQLLGQQLQSDRLRVLGENVHVQQVVDQLEDGCIFLTQDQRILFVNKAAEVVLGKPTGRIQGWRVDEALEPSHPLRWLLSEDEDGGDRRSATIVLRRDGRPREFVVSRFAVADAERSMGTMVLLKDLESIKTLRSLLSYSAKLAALGRLTSGVAHEVKNPLNAMTIHLELLKERLGASRELVQDNLEVIGNEIKRLDRAVQGFLKFVRPQELALTSVDLNGLLRGLEALLCPEWQPAGVRFVADLDPELHSIRGDEELLRQTFLNILLNACQAMPQGGTVRIATSLDQGEYVRVTISDEGIGIPAEDREKIFSLYYTTKAGGSGIGLSLVYRIVQLHDGSIDVSSEVGKGTTLVVRLPLG